MSNTFGYKCIEAIELTVSCLEDKIDEIKFDIKNDNYTNEELSESEYELVFLNDMIEYLSKLTYEYYSE